jgi:hypothetical protein
MRIYHRGSRCYSVVLDGEPDRVLEIYWVPISFFHACAQIRSIRRQLENQKARLITGEVAKDIYLTIKEHRCSLDVHP